MKTAWFRGHDLRHAPRRRRVQRIAVQQLNLDMHAVLDKRVYVILQFWNDGIFAALALYPLPTCVIGAVLILANPDEVRSRVKHASPPPTVPRYIRLARQVRVNPEAVSYLTR